MLALELYERGVCDCGFHESVASDVSNTFTFDVKVCPVCRGAAKMARLQDHADEQTDRALGEHPAPGLSRAADGRRTYIRQKSPMEIAAATRSVAE